MAGPRKSKRSTQHQMGDQYRTNCPYCLFQLEEWGQADAELWRGAKCSQMLFSFRHWCLLSLGFTHMPTSRDKDFRGLVTHKAKNSLIWVPWISHGPTCPTCINHMGMLRAELSTQAPTAVDTWTIQPPLFICMHSLAWVIIVEITHCQGRSRQGAVCFLVFGEWHTSPSEGRI